LFRQFPDLFHAVQQLFSPMHDQHVTQNVAQKANVPAQRVIFLRFNRSDMTHLPETPPLLGKVFCFQMVVQIVAARLITTPLFPG
jgi:hypothetical protein